MNGKFYLDKEKKYVIYGAGGGGLKLIPVFKEKDYCLIGFIDQRAASLGNVKGNRVWDWNTLRELSDEAENIVVIITTKNVFDHTKIAYQLAENGFRQCIYKPLSILQGYQDDELEKISRAHDTFLIDIDIPSEQKLAKVDETVYQIYYKDKLIISKNEDEVLTWIPLELLFNYKEGDAYENLNMASFFPLDNLYRMFLGNENEPYDQILDDFYTYASEWAWRNRVEVTRDLKASWLKSRKASFQQMQEISDYDFAFFFRNAPQAEMDEEGRFHMVQSGRNRVVFLAAKGYRHVPVKMRLEDYQRWINEEKFSQVKSYIENRHIDSLYAPVGHPYFKDIAVESVDYYRLVCFPIYKYLMQTFYRSSRKNIDGYCITDRDILKRVMSSCRILCNLQDDGACSRFMGAGGFNISRIGTDDHLIQLLDQLFYVAIPEYENDKVDGTYDFLITDCDEQIEELVTGSIITKIILIGKSKDYSGIMKKCGYTYVREIGRFFMLNERKEISVYERDRSL